MAIDDRLNVNLANDLKFSRCSSTHTRQDGLSSQLRFIPHPYVLRTRYANILHPFAVPFNLRQPSTLPRHCTGLLSAAFESGETDGDIF